MGRRTVLSAQQYVEENAAAINPELYRQYQEEINRAKAAAVSFATGVADGRASDVDAGREDVLRELCQVRDGYAQLIKDGQAGRLSAAEFSQAFDALESREVSSGNAVAEFTEAAAFVTDIEEDPEAYGDDYASRNPNLLHEFTF